MSTTGLCPECGDIREFSIVDKKETYEYRGESITLVNEVSICPVCSAEVSTAQQAQAALDAVREAYRTRHQLIAPHEIRAIRRRYGAGQKPFGLLLGLGEGTIACYENGDLPTTANSTLIRTAADPETFRALFDQRRHLLGPTQQRRIEACLERGPTRYAAEVESLVVREQPDEYTGFRRPEVQRLEQLLGFVALTLGTSVVKTKLLKLAFLSEYEYFRRRTVSITGWPYVRLPYGPVPQEYKLVLERSERDNYIESQDFDDGKVLFRAGPRSADLASQNIFSDDEVDTIRTVVARWKDATATELSHYTHSLPAWKQTGHAREISYALALQN